MPGRTRRPGSRRSERWLAGAPVPGPGPRGQLREAFLWSERRMVRKDATLSLFGVPYQVSDLSLAGRKVECVFDPFDMSVLEVRWNGRPHGTAVPRETGRHSHPKAKPEQPDVPPAPTGIDYLGLIRAEHEEAARRDRIRYDALAAGGEGPGHGGGRPVTAVPAAQVSAVLAWAARLSAAGPAAGAAETAAYLTAKAAVLERIAAEREAGGWSPEDAEAARGAAARARAGGRHRRAGRRGRHHHPGGLMIDLKNHYGFTRTPFGKDLAPSMLHRYPAHSEAVARITWCARERALGVITGEVGSGKTAAARAAVTALDQTRHTLIYLPDPTTGTRGIHHHIVTALGGRPAHGSAVLAAQAASLIAAEHGERGRLPCWSSTRPTCWAIPSWRRSGS